MPDRPEPETDPPSEEDWLYASDRDYLTQLEYYHGQRGRAIIPKQTQIQYAKTCAECGTSFETTRADAGYCSKRCYLRVYRQKQKKGAQAEQEGEAEGAA